MKVGFVIPVYNHGSTIDSVLSAVDGYGLPVIVVDDGNDEQNRTAIAAAVQKHPQAVLVTHKKNSGKGAAMNSGVYKALELGLTHVFQLDADGQHDTARCGFFLEQSERNPNALICGFPEYDQTVPECRQKGREISNRWARAVTLNKNIVDALCGFRIYPLEPYMRIMSRLVVFDKRMGFDPEILIRFSWKNVPIIFYSVHVTYPKECISNFRMVRDNICISLMFARLCLGMFVRFPCLLFQSIRRKKQDEKN